MEGANTFFCFLFYFLLFSIVFYCFPREGGGAEGGLRGPKLKGYGTRRYDIRLLKDTLKNYIRHVLEDEIIGNI